MQELSVKSLVEKKPEGRGSKHGVCQMRVRDLCDLIVENCDRGAAMCVPDSVSKQAFISALHESFLL